MYTHGWTHIIFAVTVRELLHKKVHSHEKQVKDAL